MKRNRKGKLQPLPPLSPLLAQPAGALPLHSACPRRGPPLSSFSPRGLLPHGPPRLFPLGPARPARLPAWTPARPRPFSPSLTLTGGTHLPFFLLPPRTSLPSSMEPTLFSRSPASAVMAETHARVYSPSSAITPAFTPPFSLPPGHIRCPL